MSQIITPKDIENPSRVSGYNNVNTVGNSPNGHGQVGERYRARFKKRPDGRNNRGPARRTALEAAQDYCDYANGNGITISPKPALKSAGHTAKRERVSTDPEYIAALGYVKDVQAQQEGKQGYVYCIAEVPQGGGLHYCKVGFSTNPQARVPELQTGNPRPLKLLCCKKGTLEDEAALHERYIDKNVLQEWFVISRDLLLEFDLDPELNPYPTEDGKAIE